MEGKEDEYPELYADVLPRSSPSYPIPPPYLNVDTNTTISSSRNDFSQGEQKIENEIEFQIHEGIVVENEEEKEYKDVNFTSTSHFNSNEGTSLVKSGNYGTVDEHDEAKKVYFSTLSHSENGKGYENDEKSSLDDLTYHPMILELMGSLSEDDVCDDGSEDEVNLRVLKIASDCGIGVKQDEENASESDSEDGLNLNFDNDEFFGCDSVDEKGKGTSKSGILGNVMSYDDDSYDYQDNWTGLGGSPEDVLHTRSDFYLPSNQTIFDINIDDLKEKRWRRPGVDSTDYFNFGLNELEWKKYCKKMPIGEAIQVKIGIAERFPSLETEPLRLSNSDTVIEIIVHDDNLDRKRNAEQFRNIDKDVIRPYPLDCYNPFSLVYAQLTCPPEERKWKIDRVEEATKMRHKNLGIPSYPARNSVKDETQLGTSKRHNNLRQSLSEKAIRVYPDKNDPKDESWRDHIAELIRRYGEDNHSDLLSIKKNHCTDLVRKYGQDKFTAQKYPNGTTKNTRMNKRHDLCTSSPRRRVWDRVTATPKNVNFRGDVNKRPSGEGNGRNTWIGKRLRTHDSESEREEGEIIRVERCDSKRKAIECRSGDSKRKAIECRSNYRREKVINQNCRQNPRKRPFSRPYSNRTLS